MTTTDQIPFLDKYSATARIAVVTANGALKYSRVTPNSFG
jgi:hypothetical protein